MRLARAICSAAIAVSLLGTSGCHARSALRRLRGADAMEVVRLDPALDQLIARDAHVEKVTGGFKFIEGPMWREGRLWLSDVVGDKIFAVTPDGKVEMLIDKAGGYPSPPADAYLGPNAMAADKDGSVLLAQQGGRKIVRIDSHLQLLPFLDSFEGKKLNSPNDLVFSPDGALWFTDPPYGLNKGDEDASKELPFNGVFRYKDGKLTALIKNLTLPNGLAFSPDGKVLYVNNSGPEMRTMRYTVAADGSVSDAQVVLSYSNHQGRGVPDGMKLDAAGNVWTTGPGGIRIVTPQGKVLGQIKLPETASNVGWGGDGKTLYITAQTGLYRITTLVGGELPLYGK